MSPLEDTCSFPSIQPIAEKRMTTKEADIIQELFFAQIFFIVEKHHSLSSNYFFVFYEHAVTSNKPTLR